MDRAAEGREIYVEDVEKAISIGERLLECIPGPNRLLKKTRGIHGTRITFSMTSEESSDCKYRLALLSLEASSVNLRDMVDLQLSQDGNYIDYHHLISLIENMINTLFRGVTEQGLKEYRTHWKASCRLAINAILTKLKVLRGNLTVTIPADTVTPPKSESQQPRPHTQQVDAARETFKELLTAVQSLQLDNETLQADNARLRQTIKELEQKLRSEEGSEAEINRLSYELMIALNELLGLKSRLVKAGIDTIRDPEGHYRAIGFTPDEFTALKAVFSEEDLGRLLKEIRRVYAKYLHPDKFNGEERPELVERYNALLAAVAVLSDPGQRDAYDAENPGADDET